ncbi:AAA family ATPase [Pseudomonas sp. RIT-PI-q]|uniref:AAA family ATPase n=1 Tax=Pseudomonas sp. RIT-PI-q TaxID=1690247 RepID=UPI0007C80D2D|nr:AAA family ATPase [Pseudomonas sp. RIT-PI-q]
MSALNNASSLNDKLHAHLSAGYPGFFIQSSEEARVDRILTLAGVNLQLHLMEWNLAYGWVDFHTKQPRTEATQTELAYCLPALADDDLSRKLIVIKDAKAALENQPLAIARLKQLLNRIQRHHRGECAVVLVAESLFIAPQIESQITLLPLPLPGREEIIDQIESFSDEQNLIIPQALLPRLAATCSGLSEEEIRQVLAMVQQPHPELNDAALGLIHYEKEQIIAKSGVLEMVKVGETASDIGGLENLKLWLKRRAEIFRRLDEAERAGVTAPKGVLIAGMPGCGKSLTAKAAAHLFQLPLLRLDIGSLLGKYIGESEHNMRRALTMAESVSPCILWIDELEKAFVGMGSGEGSEVSSRLFGYFLTWMQEKTGAVFVIATANNISALPAELLRKGRFDEVFYVGFPNAKERTAILGIHLKEDWQHLTEQQQQTLAALCRDYSGADIQNAVGEARESAFLDGQTLTHEDIERAIRATVPLRETLREQVGKYEVLFEKLKLKPASRIDGLSIAQMIQHADSPNPVRRKEVACHLECPDDLLEKLSADKDVEVRLSVYRNPNCTERLLASYLSKDKKAPDFDMSIYRLSCLHPRAPMDLLASELGKWDGSDYIQEDALLACSHLTDEVKLALFCNTKNHQTRIGICQQATLSVELQGQLIEALWDTRLSQTCVQFILLITNPALDPGYHKKIANHKTDQIIDALIGLENLSNEAQMVILADSDHFLKLAKNPNISRHVQLSLLLQALPDSDAEAVLDALKPGSSSVFFYNTLSCHPFQESHFEEAYLELSKNPSLDPDVVRVLVAYEQSDENSPIMLNLAGNPVLPKQWQLEFANSDNHWLKTSLAANPNLSDVANARLSEQGIQSFVREDYASKASPVASHKNQGATKPSATKQTTSGVVATSFSGSIFNPGTNPINGFIPSWFKTYKP